MGGVCVYTHGKEGSEGRKSGKDASKEGKEARQERKDLSTQSLPYALRQAQTDLINIFHSW